MIKYNKQNSFILMYIFMNQRYNESEHEIRREYHNTQRRNTPEQRSALVQALLAKEAKDNANKAADMLHEAFWRDFNLVKQDGIRKYHIARKDIVIQWKGRPLMPMEGKTVLGEGQMVMEVNSKGKLKIRLNSDKGDVMYNAQDLSNDDLKIELPALKNFIEQGVAMPVTSKFMGEKNTSDYSNEDVEEILRGYEQNPEDSKPR